MAEIILKEKEQKPLTAKDLSSALSGTADERKTEEKIMTIRYKAGQRPIIEFSGFWGGLDIKAVMSAVPRAYRLRRRDITRPARVAVETTGKPEQGGSDVK